jgi:hypothetical protein
MSGLGLAGAGWLAHAVAYIALRKHRRLIGELMLALTLVWGVARLVTPDYPPVGGSGRDVFWSVWMLVGMAYLSGVGYLLCLGGGKSRVVEPLCDVCDYNLTGSVSGVCPECGTPVPERAVDTAEVAPPMEKNGQG